MRAGPISSRMNVRWSLPAAAASSAAKDWIAKACEMFETERNQPILRVRRGLAVLDADVLDLEGHVDEAHPGLPIGLMLGIGHEDRHDGRRDAVVPPGDGVAVLVEARLEAFDRDRVVEAVLDVVLASPDDLHRSAADPFRNQGRLDRDSPASTCGRSRRREASRGR